jgi:hypothetical protein
MARFAKHFLLWTFIVPWCACSVWLWLDGMRQQPEFDWSVGIGGALVASLGGLFGVLCCLVVTVPLALLTFGVFSNFPRVAQDGLSRVVLVVSTALVGLGWAAGVARALNTGRTEYALLTVGLIAGAVLGLATVWLWRHSTVSSKHAAEGEV